MNRRAFLTGLAAAATTTAAGAGCGLPEDKRPRVIADDEAPRNLTTPSTPAEDGPGGPRFVVFLVDPDGRLEPVRRRVDQELAEPVLKALLQGRADDDPPNLNSAIPPTTVLNAAAVTDGVLAADFGPPEGGLNSVNGSLQVQAFAQIVWTATGLENVTSVRFSIEGSPIPVLVGSGSATAPGEPVDRSDYAALAPRAD
jgi:spore germination protein GerM